MERQSCLEKCFIIVLCLFSITLCQLFIILCDFFSLCYVHVTISAFQKYGTPEGTFLFQYLREKKSEQKELESKSKQ